MDARALPLGNSLETYGVMRGPDRAVRRSNSKLVAGLLCSFSSFVRSILGLVE